MVAIDVRLQIAVAGVAVLIPAFALAQAGRRLAGDAVIVVIER